MSMQFKLNFLAGETVTVNPDCNVHEDFPLTGELEQDNEDPTGFCVRQMKTDYEGEGYPEPTIIYVFGTEDVVKVDPMRKLIWTRP